MITVKLVKEFEQALISAGLLNSQAVVDYAKLRGYSMADAIKEGGYIVLLLNLIPGEFKTATELVQAIKKAVSR